MENRSFCCIAERGVLVNHFLKGKKRLLIIGCSGAGKSTLARRLSAAMGIPAVHLDRLYWLPGWKNRSREEFDALLRQELARDAWIMDGNFDRTLELRLARADGVLRLDFGRLACEWGVIRRVLSSYGKVRPDMGDGCPERFDWKFMKWIWNFPAQDGAKARKVLCRHPEVPVLTLRSRREVNRFLKELEDGKL